MLDDLINEGAWDVAWDLCEQEGLVLPLCEGEGVFLPIPIDLGYATNAKSSNDITRSRVLVSRSGYRRVTACNWNTGHLPINAPAWRCNWRYTSVG